MKNESSILKAINLYSSSMIQRPRSAKSDRLKTTSSLNKINKQQNTGPNESYNNFNKFSVMLPKTVPSKIEKEHYYMENLSLKAEIQKLKNDLSKYKSHQKLHDVELQKRDKELNDLFKNTVAGKHAEDFIGKESLLKNLNYSQLYRKYKEKYKQLKTVLIERDKEIENIKTQMKFTKINEYVIQNKVLLDEVDKYKILLKKNEEISSLKQQNIDNNIHENNEIINSEEMNLNYLNDKIKDLETRNTFLIEQNLILNQQLLQIHSLTNNNNNVSIRNLFSSHIFYESVNFNFFLEGICKEHNSTGLIEMNSSSNINKRISDLTKENQNLANEIKKINTYTKDLKTNVQKGAFSQNELNQSHRVTEKSNRFCYSLKEIERYYLDDLKFIKTIYLLMKSIFHSYNISYKNFISFHKLELQNNMNSNMLYDSLLKYFFKLQIISDFEDLFSVHILCVTLVKEYEKSTFNDFQHYLKKNLFVEEEKKEPREYLTKLFELKETLLDKRENSFSKFLEESTGDFIKLKTFKKLIALTSSKLQRDQFYSMVYLMKLYNSDNKFLGFYEINISILKEINSRMDIIILREKIDSVHNLSSNQEESILNLIYSPNINLNFTDILNIFNNYSDYPITSIFKKLKDYLILKGLNLTLEDNIILYKAIISGKLYDRVKQFRKDILIIKKKSNLELDDSVEDMLFAEVIVNGTSRPEVPKLKPKPTSELMINNFPELSESSMLSDYNLSRINELKKGKNEEEIDLNKENKVVDDIPEDI